MSRYSAKMLMHFHAPRNCGVLEDADVVGYGRLAGRSPSTQLYLKFADDVISQAAFTTFGCGASIASASALTEMIIGRTIDECRRLTTHHILAELSGLPPDKEFCTEIVLAALQDGLRQWAGDCTTSTHLDPP